jgi:anti-sigma regulatory factor (Ser/Thr protein kinase)
MIDNLTAAPVFSSLIKIHYDQRFVRHAQQFVESLAKTAGASDNEIMKLAMLVEETLVFLIEKFVDKRLEAHIEICFTLFDDNKIVIEIADIGPPIHESRIPEFDIDDESSVTGLWYKLASELSDKFEFINMKNKGWLVRAEKEIEAVTFESEYPGINDAQQAESASDGRKEVRLRLATADDVPELNDLAFSTYRYTYAIDFYDLQALERAIKNKLYEIRVMESDRKIVCGYVVKYPKSGENWAEIGSAMILPEYRNIFVLRNSMASMENHIKDNPHNCDFFVSHVVTAHTRSQRILNKMNKGFIPMFLFLNMVPSPKFIGIGANTGGRESLIHSYHLNQELRVEKIFTTGADREIISDLIVDAGLNIEIDHANSDPTEPESDITTEASLIAGFAKINVESIGGDWFPVLNNLIVSFISSGIESVNVNIATTAPLPSDFESKMESLNLVFCGLSLRSIDCIDMAYCLTTTPPKFDKIRLSGTIANKLLEYIENNYKRLAQRQSRLFGH